MTDLRVRGAGGAGTTLLLLHGLGATGDVWDRWRPLLAERWRGRWVAPDLPGHGGSAPLRRYSFGSLATAVATVLDPGERVVVLGHSLGGVVGLTLASGWFGVPVHAVVGLGIKVAWTPTELAKAAELAARRPALLPDRDAALERHLRTSGLAGLVPAGDPRLAAGVRAEGGRWRLAVDPAAFGVGAPDLPGLLAAARSRVVLVRGEQDPMVSADQLDQLHPSAVSLAGLGHNAHVEDPDAVLRLVQPYAG